MAPLNLYVHEKSSACCAKWNMQMHKMVIHLCHQSSIYFVIFMGFLFCCTLQELWLQQIYFVVIFQSQYASSITAVSFLLACNIPGCQSFQHRQKCLWMCFRTTKCKES